MMKNKVIAILTACTLCLAPCAFTQDLHFSQFFNSPLSTNPANTGFIPDGDYRIGINYRNQWSSVMALPYKTMSAFGDMQVMQKEDNTGWVGIGGLILRDVAGSGNLTSTKVYGSIAYHQMIDHIRKAKRITLKEEFREESRVYDKPVQNTKKILEQALGRLPETQRSLVLLKDYEGYSYEEIGKITGLNESQVKVYLHRARIQLKNYLVSPENVM